MLRQSGKESCLNIVRGLAKWLRSAQYVKLEKLGNMKELLCGYLVFLLFLVHIFLPNVYSTCVNYNSWWLIQQSYGTEKLQNLFMKGVMDYFLFGQEMEKNQTNSFRHFVLHFCLIFWSGGVILGSTLPTAGSTTLSITMTSSHPQNQYPQNFWMDSYLNLTFQPLFRFCVA